MKISNFFLEFFYVFFNKFMLSKCSLAMSCYFYTTKYPETSATTTPLNHAHPINFEEEKKPK
jgi:hypothetical protein